MSLPRYGKLNYTFNADVDTRHYTSDPVDVGWFLVRATVDLDVIFARTVQRAARSKSGRATALHGAIVVKAKRLDTGTVEPVTKGRKA